MEITELNSRPEIQHDGKLAEVYSQFVRLTGELSKRPLHDDVVVLINREIADLNSNVLEDKEMIKMIKKAQNRVVKLVEKEQKLVPINYYRNLWLALGMSAFGIPIGVVFGTTLGNMGYLALGIPLGMAIGLGVGAGLDKKAMEDGRQLDVELKY